MRLGLSVPEEYLIKVIRNDSYVHKLDKLFLQFNYLCRVSFTVRKLHHNDECKGIPLNVSIYQQTKLPYFAGLLHSIKIAIHLSEDTSFNYTESMIIQQRFIILQVQNDRKSSCKLHININPFVSVLSPTTIGRPIWNLEYTFYIYLNDIKFIYLLSHRNN